LGEKPHCPWTSLKTSSARRCRGGPVGTVSVTIAAVPKTVAALMALAELATVPDRQA
jgi:hypothetical protein